MSASPQRTAADPCDGLAPLEETPAPVGGPRAPRPPGRSARRRPPTGGGRRACPASSWWKQRRRADEPVDVDLVAGDVRRSRRPSPNRAWRGRADPTARLGDSPATISSQRNCRVAPGGADRTSRTSDGHPANPSHAARSSPSRPASAVTSASVNASSSAPTSTTCPAARRRASGIGTGRGWRARGGRGGAGASPARARAARRPTRPGARGGRR